MLVAERERKWREVPQWAKSLRERRLELGLSQEEMAFRAGISQSLLSQIERGVQNPLRMSVDNFLRYLSALRWTPKEFAEATGLQVSSEYETAYILEAFAQNFEDWIRLPVYGAASAGTADAEPLEGEYVGVPREFLARKGVRDPRQVRVYRVNGSCMVSDEARRMERNIAPGDYILVDISRRPQAGDVVVAWWPEQEKLVVKRYKVEGDNILLYPANPMHPVVVLPREEDVNILGVVIARLG